MIEPMQCVQCKRRIFYDPKTDTWPKICPWCRCTGEFLEPLDGVRRLEWGIGLRVTKDCFPILTGLDKGFLQSLLITPW